MIIWSLPLIGLDNFSSFSWSLLNHSQLDALSAACPSGAFTAALRCLPSMHRDLNVVNTDCAGKPRQPTYTGNSQVCHPRSLQRSFRSVYLDFSNSYALWQLYSQGTVSSTMTRRFVAADWMTMSGLSDVWTMSGNCSFLSRSVWCVHSLACCRMSCFFAIAGRHIRWAFFDNRDIGDASGSLVVFLLAFQF